MSFIKITEQDSLYNDLERKSVRELLEDINTEDQKVALAVRKTIPKIEELVLQIVPRMKQGGRIFYLGAGTSGRLGVLDASEIPPTFGMPPTLIVGLIAGGDTALRNPVENAEDDEERGWQELLEHQVNTKDTVIGIAASGTTPYVIGALRKARERGILTASISSNPDSPMAMEVDSHIQLPFSSFNFSLKNPSNSSISSSVSSFFLLMYPKTTLFFLNSSGMPLFAAFLSLER